MIWRSPKYTGPERRKVPRWRPRPLRVLLVLLGVAATGYVGAALWLMVHEGQMVFQAVQTLGPARPPFPYEQVTIPRADSARQFAWVMQQGDAEERPWALYLHGNPSTVASVVNISHYELLRNIGLDVLAPEYRGFGGVEGTPSEAGLLADARAAYDYLREHRRISASRIVVYGWSLGGAVAIDLASRVEIAAVIIEGAPASMVDIARQRYPFLPVRLLMRHPFESLRKIQGVSAPILLLHSPEDEVVPPDHARQLFEAAPGRKRLIEVRGGHVEASSVDGKRIERAIGAFLDEAGIRTAAGVP